MYHKIIEDTTKNKQKVFIPIFIQQYSTTV